MAKSKYIAASRIEFGTVKDGKLLVTVIEAGDSADSLPEDVLGQLIKSGAVPDPTPTAPPAPEPPKA